MKGIYYISLLVPIVAVLYCLLPLKGVEGDNGSVGNLGLQILERLQRMEVNMDFLWNRNEELYQKSQEQETEINQMKSQNSKLEDAYYQLFNANKQVKLQSQRLEQENEKLKIQIRGLQTILEQNGPDVKENLLRPESSANFRSGRGLNVPRGISSGSVGFSAVLSRTHGTNQMISGPVPFDSVLYSQGNCYNPSNGRFVAPVSGVYFFYWNVVSARDGVHTYLVDTQLVVDGVAETWARVDNGTASNMVILYVKAGKNVWIETYGGSHMFRCCETTFAGWLLS